MGSERSSKNAGKTAIPPEGCAISDAAAVNRSTSDPELDLLTLAWPHLPSTTRAAIRELVRPMLTAQKTSPTPSEMALGAPESSPSFDSVPPSKKVQQSKSEFSAEGDDSQIFDASGEQLHTRKD